MTTMRPLEISKRVLAVVLPHIASTLFSDLLRGISDTIAEEGFVMLIGDSNYDYRKERQFVELIQKQALSGVIIDTMCPVQKESMYMQYLSSVFVDTGIPVVLLERKTTAPGFGSIYVDNVKNAYLATSLLLKNGCKKIAHISGKLDNQLSLKRLDGYKRALSEYHVPFSEELLESGDFTPNSGFIAAKRLLERNTEIDGIFAANDQMAVGAIKAAKTLGISIPDDLAVIGMDNLSVSSMIEPSLSTINVPTYQMGRQAVKMLLEKKENMKYVELDCNLIVRKSTDKFASSEWELFGW